MIKSWSWSRYADYCQCPRKAKLKHVDRHREPGSAAMERGSALHEILANCVRRAVRRVPKTFTYTFEDKQYTEPFPSLKFFAGELKKLRALYAQPNHSGMTVEEDWAFTRVWHSTQWDDWTNCWVRLKLDLAHLEEDGRVLVISDWKSGKARMEEKAWYQQQLELYAVAGLLKYPHVQEVFPRLVFVDAGQVFNGEGVRRESLWQLQERWVKQTTPMFLDRTFAPRPNAKCRWCWFGQAKVAAGGPGLCEF